VEVLEHLPDEQIEDFIRTLYQRLVEHGVAVISVPTTNIALNKKHYRHYSLDLLNSHIVASGVPLSIESVEYVYSEPWWFWLFRRLFDNRLFSFEFKPLTQLAWRRIWSKYRFARHDSGHHLVATLRRQAKPHNPDAQG